ncbi:NAD(+) synthase [Candidatus Woesearchaeota archaeon]|nr:NAD(+) synthase [Candidatus Woesearchaeota archaeon]
MATVVSETSENGLETLIKKESRGKNTMKDLPNMKIALAQMEVIPGQARKNIAKMLSMIKEAKQAGVNLIAFPELCVSGYLVGDKFLEDAFCTDMMEYDEVLRKASAPDEVTGKSGIAIAYGNIFVDKIQEGHHPNEDGRSRKYNAVRIFQNGTAASRTKKISFLPEGVQPKTLLPNYRFFDDERYFSSTENTAKDFGVSLRELLQPFMIRVDDKEIPVGFEVCEDLWCEDYRKDGQSLNPTKMLIQNGAELIVNISASPWTFGKNNSRDKRLTFLRKDCGEKFVPFLYVNNIGAQNNGKNIVTFDGGSTVYNADAKPIALCKEAYREELLLVETEKIARSSVLARAEKPYIAQKLDAIITGIRHLKNIQGREEHPKFLLGMSGGVDSSVVAALLVMAVGAEKALGINIPTEFNSEATKSAAKYVAEQLGIADMVLPISELTAVNEKLLQMYTPDGKPRKLTAVQKGNIAAKIRGTNILSNLSPMYGALFTNNGNKLEVALGYATLYGDVNGAIAPLADLTKTEVYELARYLNESFFGREVIPWKLIPDRLHRFKKDDIIPSAELEFNQIDPMKFGYHDALLMMLTDYQIKTGEDFLQYFLDGNLGLKIEQTLGQIHPIEEGFGYQLMQRWGVHDAKTFVEDLDWFLPLVTTSIFKRVQAPPIIITSKTAFGYDRRESMLPWVPTRAYERLKEEILKLGEYQPLKLL